MPEKMDDIAGRLKVWREAGLIDAATVERIVAFEQDRRAGAGQGAEEERPSATEAFLYVGLLVLAIGALSIVATVWGDVESWARVALVGFPLAVALGLGSALRLSEEAPLRRGGQMAWFVSVGLLAALVLVVGEEYGPGVDSAGARLTAGTVTLVYAALLWALWPSHLQLLALGGAVAFFGQMLGSWPDVFDRRLAGGAMIVLSAGALALGEYGRLFPASSLRVIFALGLVAGGLEMQIGSAWPWEPWAIAGGSGLVLLSLRRPAFSYLAIGMGGIFFGLVVGVTEHLADRLGAQLAFTLSGVIIVAGVLIVAQLRRRFGWGRP